MRLPLIKNKFRFGVGMAITGAVICIVTSVLGIVFDAITFEKGILPYLIVFGIGYVLTACSLIFTAESNL
jgi:hypothetical protein